MQQLHKDVREPCRTLVDHEPEFGKFIGRSCFDDPQLFSINRDPPVRRLSFDLHNVRTGTPGLPCDRIRQAPKHTSALLSEDGLVSQESNQEIRWLNRGARLNAESYLDRISLMNIDQQRENVVFGIRAIL